MVASASPMPQAPSPKYGNQYDQHHTGLNLDLISLSQRVLSHRSSSTSAESVSNPEGSALSTQHSAHGRLAGISVFREIFQRLVFNFQLSTFEFGRITIQQRRAALKTERLLFTMRACRRHLLQNSIQQL